MTNWQTPRDWGLKDAVTARRLNEISEGLSYLFGRPRNDVLFIPSTNISITSTVPVVIDNNLDLSITTCGGNLLIGLSLLLRHAAASGGRYLDLLLNSSLYASTRSTSYGSQGLWSTITTDTGDYFPLGGTYFWPDISAGTHTIQVVGWTDGGTLTVMGTGAAWRHYLWVLEV